MRPEDSQSNPTIPSIGNEPTPQLNPSPIVQLQSVAVDENPLFIENQNTSSPTSPLPHTQGATSAVQTSGGINDGTTAPNSITNTASFRADLPPVQDDATSRKSRKGVKIFIFLLCIIVLGAVGYYFFFMQNGSSDLPTIVNLGSSSANKAIAQDDLVLETAHNTSYLRPQQWVAQEDAGGFGTSEKSHDKPNAAVTMNEGVVESRFVNASADLYQKLRDQTIQSLKEQLELQNKMQASTVCTSPPVSTVEPDTSSTDSIVGLATVVMKCTRDDGEYVVKSRFVIGTDGGQRTMAVAAIQKQWDENEEIFQKMLDSVQVANNS